MASRLECCKCVSMEELEDHGRMEARFFIQRGSWEDGGPVLYSERIMGGWRPGSLFREDHGRMEARFFIQRTLVTSSGSLLVLGRCVFPPGSCDEYSNLTDSYRNYLFTSTTFPGFPLDDARLVGKWWRFTGIGGDKIYNSCYTTQRGGTYYITTVPFSLPTVESETETTGTAYTHAGACNNYPFTMSVVLCPGGFHIYKPSQHRYSTSGYTTYHSECGPGDCGPLAECSGTGGCVCVTGYEIPPEHLPTAESYGCVDIDECERTSGLCGSYTNCTNNIGSYLCTCLDGFNATGSGPVGKSNPCKDIDECVEDPCGDGTCSNNVGSFSCSCFTGFILDLKATPLCQDIDECFNSTVCGPDSECTNTPGSYTCACKPGFEAVQADQEPSEKNICVDVDECDRDASVCGPHANCTNSIGSYLCTCFSGFRVNNPEMIASHAHPCTDIDECSETPGICGKQTVCTNVPGTFYCSCPDGFYPSTGILWEVGVSFCKSLHDILEELQPTEGQTKERAFLDDMDKQLIDNEGVFLPDPTVANSFSASMEVSGVGPRVTTSTVSSEGDGETGSVILDISDRLVSAIVQPGQNRTKRSVQSPTVDLSLETVGAGETSAESSVLSAGENTMEIDLGGLAKNNNGSAAAAFMTLSGMESLLSHSYFQTENQTQMLSKVITAILPFTNNTNLTQPVNFTIYHEKVPENGIVTCVYWEDRPEETGATRTGGEGQKRTMRWSVEGCWVAFTEHNKTVCSCSHLSTFALIMQIGEPPPENPFLEWLNRMCVIVGLFFFSLAIFTFLLCSWNPKINNTARLHLCLSLALSHLLLLWNDRYTEDQLACTVMAGLLHFLVIASFVWMLLEALQLHLLVRRLSKVQVIQRDGLPRPLLYLLGYGVPFVIVGVSALVYSDGYGATEDEACWLSARRNFKWALTGPVIAILALNWLLFCATLWSLRPTLANMKSDVSQSKDTRLIIFKILAQFVILGCTWILGLYQTNLFFQVLFIILNSQQGTFLFIVHCLLNKEVRDEYLKWLTCSFNKQRPEGSVKDVPSVSEDLDKAGEQTD
ncbi:adhesion G protein-coupled receptor E1-like [Xyrichtys novacula]|uniref:Adhesion G protein-coupled receptor E1-like n=1 Tax=Xyrichtys novacula TaxID=13765 RepID=A0AAV1GTC5_XYRNO|nr:adhesion G protein-coupled receptor E1-like [Xyrichtys novacula]